MIPEVTILKPKSVNELLTLLDQGNGTAKIIGGGTDIIPGFHIDSNRFKFIKTLVETRYIEEFNSITDEPDKISIGASTTFSELIKSELIKNNFHLLVESASQIGSIQIRNRATLAGNFVNNAPCADSVPPLLVYDAMVEIVSLKLNRIIPLSEFLIKPYTTQLLSDEAVLRVIIPKTEKGYKGIFYKLGRRRGVAISRISYAVVIKTNKNIIEDIRIAGGAVTPIGKRFFELEEKLKGERISQKLFARAAQELAEEILSLTGLRWSAYYKLPVVQRIFFNLFEQLSNKKND